MFVTMQYAWVIWHYITNLSWWKEKVEAYNYIVFSLLALPTQYKVNPRRANFFFLFSIAEENVELVHECCVLYQHTGNLCMSIVSYTSTWKLLHECCLYQCMGTCARVLCTIQAHGNKWNKTKKQMKKTGQNSEYGKNEVQYTTQKHCSMSAKWKNTYVSAFNYSLSHCNNMQSITFFCHIFIEHVSE